MHVSVIICSHNPKEAYLAEALSALRIQTMPKERWELIVIDNASNYLLEGKWDLAWHPNARHIREDKLGLTPARIRGIKESQGELLVFVDDDNVLNENYLQTAVDLAARYPWLGALGGSIIGKFETPPPESVVFMLPHLAIRTITTAAWACLPGTQSTHCAPCGAGMVISARVAKRYVEKVEADTLRSGLDRVGSALMSAGDSDMALCACEMDLAIGVFPQLVLTHLIPAGRLDHAYLIRLAEGMSFSHAILNFIWNRSLPSIPPPGKLDWLRKPYRKMTHFLTGGLAQKFRLQIAAANEKGLKDAMDALNALTQFEMD